MEHAYLSLHLCENPRLYLSLSCITGQKGNSIEPPAHFRLDRTLLSDLGVGWCKRMLVCFCNHKHVLSQFMHCLPTDLRMTNVWSWVSEKLLRACIVFPVKVREAGKHLRCPLSHSLKCRLNAGLVESLQTNAVHGRPEYKNRIYDLVPINLNTLN